MPARHKVVVTQRFFDDATVAYLNENDAEVAIADLPPGKADGDLTHDELVDLLGDADGWIVGHARVTRELLTALPRLQVISRRGVGYERVDLQAARDLGRVVAIGAGGNDASVADHTLGLMLAVARRLRESQNHMLAGKWAILTSADVFEKTVGIIGLGRIGKSLVKRLRGFDARILVHTQDAEPDYAAETGVEYVDLDTLIRQSDYVSLHAPLTPETHYLIDAERIRQMKPGAILINAARGGLVQDADLLEALKSGHLAGAGLDVFVSESDPSFKPVTDTLLALPNVVATPHAAASSREGLNRTNRIAAESVVAVLAGGDPAAQCVVADGRRKD